MFLLSTGIDKDLASIVETMPVTLPEVEMFSSANNTLISFHRVYIRVWQKYNIRRLQDMHLNSYISGNEYRPVTNAATSMSNETISIEESQGHCSTWPHHMWGSSGTETFTEMVNSWNNWRFPYDKHQNNFMRVIFLLCVWDNITSVKV